jgi:hypothetical protein
MTNHYITKAEWDKIPFAEKHFSSVMNLDNGYLGGVGGNNYYLDNGKDFVGKNGYQYEVAK